jgi:hypothetical protein
VFFIVWIVIEFSPLTLASSSFTGAILSASLFVSVESVIGTSFDVLNLLSGVLVVNGETRRVRLFSIVALIESDKKMTKISEA